MDRILTIIGFGAEKYTGFWVLKKETLVLDTVVLKLMLETKNKTAAGLLIASEKQYQFDTQRIITCPLVRGDQVGLVQLQHYKV